MASDSRADDAATRSLRQAVEKLLSGLSRAVFGVCAVAVGLVALFVGVGSAGESAAVFLIVGIASLLVGVVTISRLPKPDEAESTTVDASISTTETPSSDDTSADGKEPVEQESDRHRQRAD